MKRVLIVSPHFPPTNAADMHRVRLLLPFLADNGWQAEVLAIAPGSVAAPRDEWMADGLPADVPVHRLRGLDLGWSRVPCLGTLGWRARLAITRKGDELLAAGGFDLVYFSTTQWPVHLAGPRWLERFGVPFAMDYQDPWVNDYYRNHPEVTPPGGRLRYAMSEAIARRLEPGVLRRCCGFTSVSADYPAQLEARYMWASRIVRLVLPFPGSRRDLERARESAPSQDVFDPRDGLHHWVYVGRGGRDMTTAARCLFGALRDHGSSHPEFLRSLRLHFLGTSYAPAGRGVPTIAPLAAEFGISEVVAERPDRLPYAQTLRCLLDASALLAICSDDPAYTASKICPYLIARKPLLAVCHRDGGVAELLNRVGGGVCAAFDGAGDGAREVILRDWLESGAWERVGALDDEAFAPFLDDASAQRLTSWWDDLLPRRSEGFS